ncbi:MAG: lysophospholipase [Candidatus Nanopelagicales bacterium]
MTTTTQISGFLGHQELPIHTIAWTVSNPTANVILLHGYGDHSARYGAVAHKLNGAGFSVYSMDFQGHGRSGGGRGYIHSFNDFVFDAKTLIETLRTRDSRTPLFLMGHSIGGLVIVNALASPQLAEHVAGAVVLSPTVAVEGTPPDLVVQALEAAAAVLPNIPAGHVDPGKVSTDPVTVAEYETDPFVLHKKIGLRAGVQLIRGAQFALKLAGDVATPVLVLSGTRDELALPAGTQELYDRLASPDKTLTKYPDSSHELLNDVDAAQVVTQIQSWIAERT